LNNQKKEFASKRTTIKSQKLFPGTVTIAPLQHTDHIVSSNHYCLIYRSFYLFQRKGADLAVWNRCIKANTPFSC